MHPELRLRVDLSVDPYQDGGAVVSEAGGPASQVLRADPRASESIEGVLVSLET